MGFFTGRTQSQAQVTVSVPAAMQTVPTESMPPADAEPAAPPESAAAPEPTEAVVRNPININTATKEEFTSLPGIGDVLAQRILDYRESNGSFSTVMELLNVEGIGKQRMVELLDLVTTGG